MKRLRSIQWYKRHGPVWFASVLLVAVLLSMVSKHAAVTFVTATAIWASLARSSRNKDEGALICVTAEARVILKQFASDDVELHSDVVMAMRSAGKPLVTQLYEALRAQQEAAVTKLPDHKRRLGSILLLSIGSLPFIRFAGPPTGFWIFVSMALLYGFAFEASALRRMPPEQQILISALAELGDVRSTQYFIEAVRLGDKKTRSAARDAIIRVLPVMSETDASKVPSEQRLVLYRQLLFNDELFVRAILGAVPTFDDAGALPMVEKLAAGCGLARTNVEIRGTAAALLPMLRSRHDLKHGDQTLLRAGSEDVKNTATALRAAQYVPDPAEKAQLLRTGVSDEPEINQ